MDSFCTLSPKWDIPNVKAFTILKQANDASPISFSHDSKLGDSSREILSSYIKPASSVTWLRQVHGNEILELPVKGEPEADGSFTFQKGVVCAILTADCLPIVFSDCDGVKVGAVHAGRRGLQHGVISNMIRNLEIPADKIRVWIGPGIAAKSYLISKEIRKEFLDLSEEYASVFTKFDENQYYMDLYRVARMQLESHGILKDSIFGENWDTFSDERLHSARRDGAHSGRMATVVWME